MTDVAQLSGLGLSVAVHEAVAHCRKKVEARPQPWGALDYLSIGVSARDAIAPELPAALRAAGLAPAVHLLEVNLVRPIAEQRATIDKLLRLIDRLEPACVEEDVGFWAWGTTELEQHMLPPIFDEQTVEVVARNAAELQASIGVPFYAENPPVHCDLGTLDLLTFMEQVAEAAGCGLVLDIGHLVGYCAITGREPDEYLAAWRGIRHVRELHVAGYTLSPDTALPMWFDDHAEAISDYSLDLAAQARELSGRSLPITLEQEGAKLVRVAEHISRVSRRFFS